MNDPTITNHHSASMTITHQPSLAINFRRVPAIMRPTARPCSRSSRCWPSKMRTRRTPRCLARHGHHFFQLMWIEDEVLGCAFAVSCWQLTMVMGGYQIPYRVDSHGCIPAIPPDAHPSKSVFLPYTPHYPTKLDGLEKPAMVIGFPAPG